LRGGRKKRQKRKLHSTTCETLTNMADGALVCHFPLLISLHLMTVANVHISRKCVCPRVETLTVRRANLPVTAQHPRLVAALAVTRVDAGQAPISLAHLVQARLCLAVDKFATLEDMFVAATGG
jgi:hypothetical protein